MDAFIQMLESAIGSFVCADGGIYRGQCPQFPRHIATQCGLSWPGKTYNGDRLVDRLVELGGYYGESSRGYRICSGTKVNHTWVEVKINGQWVIYEQNAQREGTKTASFGLGTVYSVSKSEIRGAWRNDARYAAHPLIDAYIDAHSTPEPTPTPTPTPEPTPEPEPKDDYVYYTYQKGDTFGQVLIKLGLDEGHLWGANGTVAYYTEQLHEQGIWGNIPIGTTIKLKPRK